MAMFMEPLFDASDGDIKKVLRELAPMTDFSYMALVAELDRRAANRQAESNQRLGWVVAIATIANAIAALLAWAAVSGFELWPW